MDTVILLTGEKFIANTGRPTYALNKEYSVAVQAAGGVPVLAVDAESAGAYARVAQGLVLTGGKDISPSFYKQSNHLETKDDPARDSMELALIEAFLAEGKPVLGICRGFQLLNAYFQGTLKQHLPDELPQAHTGGTEHSVEIEKDSTLGRLFGCTSLNVNSYHHQGIHTLGKGLRATAVANSLGKYPLIEAFEHTERPVLAVQWHPERMIYLPENSNLSDMSPLFFWFLQQSGGIGF